MITIVSAAEQADSNSRYSPKISSGATMIYGAV